jgi:hypothetical protein
MCPETLSKSLETLSISVAAEVGPLLDYRDTRAS